MRKLLKYFGIGCLVLSIIGFFFGIALLTAFSFSEVFDHHNLIYILGMVPAFLLVATTIGGFIEETR